MATSRPGCCAAHRTSRARQDAALTGCAGFLYMGVKTQNIELRESAMSLQTSAFKACLVLAIAMWSAATSLPATGATVSVRGQSTSSRRWGMDRTSISWRVFIERLRQKLGVAVGLENVTEGGDHRRPARVDRQTGWLHVLISGSGCRKHAGRHDKCGLQVRGLRALARGVRCPLFFCDQCGACQRHSVVQVSY